MNTDVSEERANFVFRVQFNDVNLWTDFIHRSSILLATFLYDQFAFLPLTWIPRMEAATFPLIFLYGCADLLLLWAENFYTT
jgi:hypothetical protein